MYCRCVFTFEVININICSEYVEYRYVHHIINYLQLTLFIQVPTHHIIVLSSINITFLQCENAIS